MNDLLQRLGQRIRELRNQKGWSQEAFADICGVHRTYMGHLERGEKNLSFRSVLRVADALGVTLSELFAGLENGQEPSSAEISRGRRKSVGQPALDRGTVLEELATVEKAVKRLKQIALSEIMLAGLRSDSRKARPPQKKQPRT